MGSPSPGGLAASANLTARIVVDDDGGLGALLLAIENDLDSTTSSVAMFLTASFGFLPCLSDTVFFFFFFGCKSSSSPGGFEALEMEPGHHHHHQARGALSCGGGKTLIRKCGQVLGAHPKLLWILASTEVWERFSYYGMRAMLVLYLSNVLLARDNLDQVGGLRLLAKACGAGGVLAPATEISDQDRQKAVQAFSSQLYGMYTSCVYLTALGGGES